MTCVVSFVGASVDASDQVAYGLGTANGKRGGKDFDESIVNVTIKALNAGFTHLDCAEGTSTTAHP